MNHDRLYLFDSFYSGQGFAEFQTLLRKRGLKSSVIQNVNGYQTYLILNVHHKKEKCKVSVEFFHDELSAISFYPENYKSFSRKALGKSVVPTTVINMTTKQGVQIRNAEWLDAYGITWRDLKRYAELQEWVISNT